MPMRKQRPMDMMVNVKLDFKGEKIMKEYFICNIEMMDSPFVVKARRLTEEEKSHCAEWFKEKGFVPVEDIVYLKKY